MATAQDGSFDACADHLVGNSKCGSTYDKSHKNTVSNQQQQQQEISSYWRLQQVFTGNSGKFVHDFRFDLDLLAMNYSLIFAIRRSQVCF